MILYCIILLYLLHLFIPHCMIPHMVTCRFLCPFMLLSLAALTLVMFITQDAICSEIMSYGVFIHAP